MIALSRLRLDSAAKRPATQRLSGMGRPALVVVAVGALALLGYARALTPLPDLSGVAGLPLVAPCGFRFATGYPCLTCGMTRSFALLADGCLIDGIRVQPFGALLFLITLLLPALSIALLFRNRPLEPLLRSLDWRRTIGVFALLALLAWGYTAAMTWHEHRTSAAAAGRRP